MMIMMTMVITLMRKSTDLNEKSIIEKIIYLIKHEDNYTQATKIMIENNISIEDLSEKTIKLSQLEFAKLADTIIENRR